MKRIDVVLGFTLLSVLAGVVALLAGSAGADARGLAALSTALSMGVAPWALALGLLVLLLPRPALPMVATFATVGFAAVALGVIGVSQAAASRAGSGTGAGPGSGSGSGSSGTADAVGASGGLASLVVPLATLALAAMAFAVGRVVWTGLQQGRLARRPFIVGLITVVSAIAGAALVVLMAIVGSLAVPLIALVASIVLVVFRVRQARRAAPPVE
ncbi:hypothetical protein OSC27_01675 [Microbacterium sp. STN6]|uniref:hypothetical protein n=1 Tax=Microbacterium sp. STN6 TaxID=2995588 RepID=UPI002260EFC7|nr:hypothetical protein [Microbacterium sp. STN6]MCX7520980.1 hypothetical protein [Microbacterium sp. STN6]